MNWTTELVKQAKRKNRKRLREQQKKLAEELREMQRQEVATKLIREREESKDAASECLYSCVSLQYLVPTAGVCDFCLKYGIAFIGKKEH